MFCNLWLPFYMNLNSIYRYLLITFLAVQVDIVIAIGLYLKNYEGS